MHAHHILFAGALPFFAASLHLFGADGGITGSVRDQDGNALAGAKVHYRRLQTFAKNSWTPLGPFADALIETGPDGSFGARDLPAGTYVLCAYGPKPNHLPSCDWSLPVSTIAVGGGLTGGVTLTVRNGTLVRFVLQDPNRLLASGLRLGLTLMLGDGRYVTARPATGSGGSTPEYRAAVPRTTVSRLIVEGDVDLADSLGTTVRKDRIGLTLPAFSGDEAVVTLTVR
ncbi:MAG: carboxypeptidase-like regulatory domain-containing protein [Bryobacteraceae bacterium]